MNEMMNDNNRKNRYIKSLYKGTEHVIYELRIIALKHSTRHWHGADMFSRELTVLSARRISSGQKTVNKQSTPAQWGYRKGHHDI